MTVKNLTVKNEQKNEHNNAIQRAKIIRGK